MLAFLARWRLRLPRRRNAMLNRAGLLVVPRAWTPMRLTELGKRRSERSPLGAPQSASEASGSLEFGGQKPRPLAGRNWQSGYSGLLPKREKRRTGPAGGRKRIDVNFSSPLTVCHDWTRNEIELAHVSLEHYQQLLRRSASGRLGVLRRIYDMKSYMTLHHFGH